MDVRRIEKKIAKMVVSSGKFILEMDGRGDIVLQHSGMRGDVFLGDYAEKRGTKSILNKAEIEDLESGWEVEISDSERRAGHLHELWDMNIMSSDRTATGYEPSKVAGMIAKYFRINDKHKKYDTPDGSELVFFSTPDGVEELTAEIINNRNGFLVYINIRLEEGGFFAEQADDRSDSVKAAEKASRKALKELKSRKKSSNRKASLQNRDYSGPVDWNKEAVKSPVYLFESLLKGKTVKDRMIENEWKRIRKTIPEFKGKVGKSFFDALVDTEFLLNRLVKYGKYEGLQDDDWKLMEDTVKELKQGIKELTSSEKIESRHDSLSDQVMDGLGEAVEILDKLDRVLGNSYRGDRGDHDVAVSEIRKKLAKASDALNSSKYFGLFKDLDW